MQKLVSNGLHIALLLNEVSGEKETRKLKQNFQKLLRN